MRRLEPAPHFLSVEQQLESLVPVVPNEFDGMTFMYTDVASAREAHELGGVLY